MMLFVFCFVSVGCSEEIITHDEVKVSQAVCYRLSVSSNNL